MFGLTQADILKFFIIFVRMGAIMLIIPFYGEKGAPVLVKLALAIMITIIVFPVISVDESLLKSVTFLGTAILLIQSLLVGLLIGFIPVLLFTGFQLGGEIAGFNIGFAMVSVLDPLSESRISLIAQLNYIFAMLVFISINGHFYLLEGIVTSFKVMPLIGSTFPDITGQMLLQISSKIFVIGMKVAAPVLVAILLTNTGLGILARTIPQLNIFIIGFPIQISVGLITLGLSIPTFVFLFEKMFKETYRNWMFFIKAF